MTELLISRLVVAVICTTVCQAHAQGQDAPRDPTKPPSGVVQPALLASRTFHGGGLQAILHSGKRQAVMINGQMVELGGHYGDAELIEVGGGRAVLRDPQGGMVELRLIKTPIRVKRRDDVVNGK